MHGKNMSVRRCLEIGWLIFSINGCLSCSIGSEKAASQTNNTNAAFREDRFLDHPTTATHIQVLDRELWLISDQIRLWKTEDRGSTWMESYLPIEQQGERLYIRGVSFISDQNGFLVDIGVIYRTDNGGTKWSKIGTIKSDAEYVINNCYFVDSIHGWTVGTVLRKDFMSNPKAPPYIGAIFGTKDGGNTWEQQRLNMPDDRSGNQRRWDLRDVFFITEKIGWAVGDTVTYWTLDGGDHWHYSQAQGGVCEHVHFVDRQNGWITMRDNNEILKSSDGGKRWMVVPGPAPFIGVPSEVVFLTPQHGFCACVYLYETTDGGLTWLRRKDVEGIDGVEYRHIRQALDGTLVVLGMGNNRMRSLASNNYGRTFYLCCSD